MGKGKFSLENSCSQCARAISVARANDPDDARNYAQQGCAMQNRGITLCGGGRFGTSPLECVGHGGTKLGVGQRGICGQKCSKYTKRNHAPKRPVII